jgi:deoxyribose-phosphate aldolase
MSGVSIAKTLELLLVEPTVTGTDVDAACRRARELHLASVCVAPVHVARATSELADGDTQVTAAISFPAGHDRVEVKQLAIDLARRDGARRISVALDHSSLATGDVTAAQAELRALLAHEHRAVLGGVVADPYLTVVLETMQYDLESLAPLFDAFHESSIGFVQTSTGWFNHAVTDEHIRHLRRSIPADVGIKAVGGVASLEDAEGLVNAGAVRIVTGSAIAIALDEKRQHEMRSVS